MQKSSTHRLWRDQEEPSGFNHIESGQDERVVIAYGREEASGIAPLSYRSFRFRTVSLPRAGGVAGEAYDPWFSRLQGRDVLLWPDTGPGADVIAHAHALRIADLGAASVGVLEPRKVTTILPTEQAFFSDDELRHRLRGMIRNAFADAAALAVPAQGGRPGRAMVACRTDVDGAALVAEIAGFLRGSMVLREGLHDALALWCLHAWCARETDSPIDMSPRLVLRGSSMAGDHSRALRVMSWLVPAPRVVSCANARGIVELAMQPGTTLLLDDFAGDMFRQRDVCSVVAAGARRDSGFVSGARRHIGAVWKSCFSPTVIATCGALPPSIAMHAIVADVHDLGSHPVWSEPVFGYVPDEVMALRAALQACARKIACDLQADERLSAPLASALHDRNWQPLFAIAQAVATEEDASALLDARRSAAACMSRDLGLLHHIERLFRQDGDAHLSSARIVDSLDATSADQEPGDDPVLDKRTLAEKLLQFGLRPTVVRLAGGGTARGYRAGELKTAFRRYLVDEDEAPAPQAPVADVTPTPDM